MQALLVEIASESGRRASDWVQRDRALILTSLLAWLRADELQRCNIGDVRRTDDGAVIHVRGKGGKDRRVPVEMSLVDVLEDYLDSRAVRLPTTVKRRLSAARGLAAWPPNDPLFVGSDGERITRGTLQYRVLRAFRRDGIDTGRAKGALVHGLRHTFRYRAGQCRRERLCLDEASRPRVHGHFTAVRHGRRSGKTHGRSPEQDLQPPRSVVTGGAAHPILLRQVQFTERRSYMK